MSVFLIYIFLLAQIEIKVDIRNMAIPWYETSEYSIDVTSKDNAVCPEWAPPKDENNNLVIELKDKVSLDNRCSIKWYVDPLKSGIYFIPPASVKINKVETIKTSAFVLDVREPTQDEISKLIMVDDIIEPNIKNPWQYYLKLIILGVILGVILVSFGYFLYKYFYSTPDIPVKVELPWEKALRRLRELKDKDLPSQGLYEPYYIQLSWILRYYIEDRFHIKAPELTTQEFIETAIKNKDFPSEHHSYLVPFLKHCDRVKFAKLEPTLEQMEESFKVVWDFVEKTSTKLTDNNGDGQLNIGQKSIDNG